MASLSKGNEPFPSPPPYFIPDASRTGQDGSVYSIHSPFSPLPPPPPFSFSPGVCYSTQATSPAPVSTLPPSSPKLKFVSHETELYRSPALTTCPYCQTRVTTLVTYRAGTHVWLTCLVFVLFGLLLGCCLIPLFVNYFKDAYHTCPRCRRILHTQRKTCRE